MKSILKMPSIHKKKKSTFKLKPIGLEDLGADSSGSSDLNISRQNEYRTEEISKSFHVVQDLFGQEQARNTLTI